MDDGEGAGISIVDAPLLVGELMFDQLIFDAVIRQRTCHIEAERAQIAGQHLHRRDAAGLDSGDEFAAGSEGKVLAAPEPEALRIGKIVYGRGARRRDIDDARVRQRVLQPKPCPPLLRRSDVAAVAFAAAGVLHGMGFIEDDDAVEIGAEPVDDLAHARDFLAALVGTQRRIGGEQNLPHRSLRACLGESATAA